MAEIAERRLTPGQLKDVASKVVLDRIRGKGLGLVARTTLRPHTRVGIYGGKLYTKAQHAKLKGWGKYSIDYWKKTAGGALRGGYVMDPGNNPSQVLAAYINEPGGTQLPNSVWVRNDSTGGMELWTVRAVSAGEELTACYGDAYPREYATTCTSVAAGAAAHLHHLPRGSRRPREL